MLFFKSLQILNESSLILAYHDRSDGGLFVSLAEMGFAGHTGIDIELDNEDLIAALFNEELGAVLQIKQENKKTVEQCFINAGIQRNAIRTIGKLNHDYSFDIKHNNTEIAKFDLSELHKKWSETSYKIQALRDNPECAKQEFEQTTDKNNTGLFLHTTFQFEHGFAPEVNTNSKPKMAVLREQGVNGQIEMAAAFDRAGFECIDIHMQDLIDNQIRLDSFNALVACGGFSYGDVLGAGGGWAKTILYNDKLNKMFESFFNRKTTITLGVCNGCQMLSQLRELVPGANSWPHFLKNKSEQFEARLVMVEVMSSPSVLFNGMQGSKIPVVVAHGEGRVPETTSANNPVLRYIDNFGKTTEIYPFNPNGAASGLTGFTNDDGRITIMMPHPERVFLSKQFSSLSPTWHNEYSPWMKLFLNARTFFD